MKRKDLEGGWWAPLAWLIFIIAILWVLWYFTGGPQRAAQEGDSPFLNPDTGTTYNGVGH